ncbi:GGDEF domain-containing protein [Terriglobus sp. RCC_193]|uniref:GGDEF domain-containing protein n=1 Tax=Terriglobus sp. RCC_193 TaxID=3239218 RepID=UPI003524E48D
MATAVMLVAFPVLLGWVLPDTAQFVPSGWMAMKANTALLILMSLASFLCTERDRSRWMKRFGFVAGVAVFVLAGATALQFTDVYLFPVNTFPINTMLAQDPYGTIPGQPSLQASIGFLLMGVALCALSGQAHRTLRVADVMAMLLILFLLSFVGSIFFAREGSPGWSLKNQIAPGTFVCLCLLTLLVALRRTEPGGIFHIFRERGIGGKTARLAGPAALAFPFVLSGLREVMIRFHLLAANYAVAFAPAVTAVLALLFVLLLARRSRDLETALHDLSLRDELTGVYNRRGFHLLAEQAFREALRASSGFSVIFLDVDDLKVINDTAGHDDGSRLLQRMAKELHHAFRLTDIVGRIGGDEFLVAAKATQNEILHAIQRLHDATAVASDDEFPLRFSYGIASLETTSDTLTDLIQQADARMYETKRRRKGESGWHSRMESREHLQQ